VPTDPGTRRILLAIDGEPHTDAAVHWALDAAASLGQSLTAIHVKDPYLKQFHNEIYAQGREEYLDHVDEQLEQLASEAVARFEASARETDVDWSVEVLDGDPAKAIATVAKEDQYGVVVLGRRRRDHLTRWRSRDLPAKLMGVLDGVRLLVVPQPD